MDFRSFRQAKAVSICRPSEGGMGRLPMASMDPIDRVRGEAGTEDLAEGPSRDLVSAAALHQFLCTSFAGSPTSLMIELHSALLSNRDSDIALSILRNLQFFFLDIDDNRDLSR